MVVAGLALISNALAFSAMQRKGPMEARLIEQYVIDLPDQQLQRYAVNAAFPRAK
jgi:hypothetical protein